MFLSHLPSKRGLTLVEAIVGLSLLSLVMVLAYRLFVPTLVFLGTVGDRLDAAQDVRLVVDRLARILHETTIDRTRVYLRECPHSECPANTGRGCSTDHECIGIGTARVACQGEFQIGTGTPSWQATIYIWRDPTSDELRLRCDPTTTFPVANWPPPTLSSYVVIARRAVAVAFRVRLSDDGNPVAIAVSVQEQTAGAFGRWSAARSRFLSEIIYLPENSSP